MTATETVRAYLAAMEARDLAAAAAFLAPGFTMVFPGRVEFTAPGQLVAWARERYRCVAKSDQHFDECRAGEDTVVYCFGILHGTWLDGSSFAGIRFIDRFTLREGLITGQLVWNDLAEVQAMQRGRGRY